MKSILLTHKGLESVAALEVKEILKLACKQVDSGVLFNTTINGLLQLAYQSQSALRVLIHLGSCKVKDIKHLSAEIKTQIEQFNMDEIKALFGPFRVDCERFGMHAFTSVEVEEILLGAFKQKTSLKVDFKKPSLHLYAYVHQDTAHWGIDVAGKDLSKRTYKLHNFGSSIKGTLAYGVCRLAGVTKTNVVLDPFCGTGTIPIEASLFQTGKSPHFYDKTFLLSGKGTFDPEPIDKKIKNLTKTVTGTDSKQKYLSSTKKNAKVAGVDFTMSRMDVEWLDTKFGKESVDIVVTKPLVPSKHVDEKTAHKLYKDLFYNMGYVLKKTGTLAILSTKPEYVEKVAKAFPFTLINHYTLEAGQAEYGLVVFKHGM